MKSKYLTSSTFNLLLYVALMILIVIAFVDPFSSHLTKYLEKNIGSVTLSLGLLLELKTLASSTSYSHVPLISGVSASTVDSLSTAIDYLSWSNILITAQLILITLSKSVLLKVALITAFAGTFIDKYQTFSLKIMVLLLLINPGLPAYVSGIKYLAQEAKLDLGDDLTKELQKTHANYNKRVVANKKQEQQRNHQQLESAEAKGKDKISLIKRVEDRASDDLKKVDNRIIESVSDAYKVIKIAIKEITIKSINLLTSVLIQFILLPFLFFYGIFTLYKKFISTNLQSTAFIEKIIVFETAIISLSLLFSIF